MTDWKTRLWGLFIWGVAAVLAVSGLGAVVLLRDISAGVASGAYNREAASGFALMALVVWGGSAVLLLLTLAIDGGVWVIRTVGDEAISLREPARRVGIELLVAGVLAVFGIGSGSARGVFAVLLLGSLVLYIWVLIHISVSTVGVVRGVVAGS